MATDSGFDPEEGDNLVSQVIIDNYAERRAWIRAMLMRELGEFKRRFPRRGHMLLPRIQFNENWETPWEKGPVNTYGAVDVFNGTGYVPYEDKNIKTLQWQYYFICSGSERARFGSKAWATECIPPKAFIWGMLSRLSKTPDKVIDTSTKNKSMKDLVDEYLAGFKTINQWWYLYTETRVELLRLIDRGRMLSVAMLDMRDSSMNFGTAPQPPVFDILQSAASLNRNGKRSLFDHLKDSSGDDGDAEGDWA
jgi:hypothetical protein